jgi:hypothetical protein
MKKLIPTISKMAMGGEPPRKPIYVSNKNNPRLKSYQDSLSLYKKYPSSETDEYINHSSIKYQIKDANNIINLHPNADTRELYKKTYKNIDFVNNTKIQPVSFSLGKWNSSGTSHSRERTFNYKKPVQPVAYRAATNPVADIKKIQMETTKLDTVPKITNFEQRIQNPVLNMHNKDGTTSTHKMMSFEADGKYYAAPTIVEQNGKLVELTKDEAFKYAMKNKEYKEFKTDKEAKDYANNGYKKGTPLSQTPPTPLTKKQYYEVPDANGKNVLLTPEQFSRMSSGNKNDLMSKSPIMNKPKYFYEMNSSGKRQLVPENKIREYMQTKNK